MLDNNAITETVNGDLDNCVDTKAGEDEVSLENPCQGEENTVEVDDDLFSDCNLLIMIVLGFTSVIFLSLIPQNSFETQILSQLSATTKQATSVPQDGPNTIYRAASPATPFFPLSSIVHDLYRGELTPAIELLKQNDIVFVMYYSSWSTASIIAKNEFERAAYFFKHRVPFVAINCWHEFSQCKLKYNFYNFPSFYVYVDGMDRGFIYSGVEKMAYFVRFLESILNPLTHIHNSSQLIKFVSNQDSSLVGYFNLSSPEPESRFQQFYYASLRSIEKDFIQPVKFGVLSNQTFASRYAIDDVKPLLLMRSVKENLVYPLENNFTSTAITHWINRNKVKPLVEWYFPHGKKSTDLYKILWSGPTVVLFTPFDGCSSYNSNVSLLREVALQYHSCNTTSDITTKIAVYIQGSTDSRKLETNPSLCLTCPNHTYDTAAKSTCCYSIDHPSRHCQVCINQAPCSGHCSECSLIPNYLYHTTKPSEHNQSCWTFKQQKDFINLNQVCCQFSHSGRRPTDNYISSHTACSKTKKTSFSYPQDISYKNLSNSSALCNANTSLNFLAVDSQIYSEYLTKFGILPNDHLTSPLAIVDITNEAHYLLKGKFTKQNIVSFLELYSSGDLQREVTVYENKAKVPTNLVSESATRFEIEDITTDKLDGVLLKRQTDIVILFHTKWCIHCKSIYHTYLSTSRFLTKLTTMRFYRLDVSTNTLPWKYVASKVPSIILFPMASDPERLWPVEGLSSEDIFKFIISHSSAYHLVELILKGKDVPDLNAIIRCNIGKLIQQLSPLERQSSNVYFNHIISKSRLAVQFRLLSLRKVYRLLRGPSLSRCRVCLKRALKLSKFYKEILNTRFL